MTFPCCCGISLKDGFRCLAIIVIALNTLDILFTWIGVFGHSKRSELAAMIRFGLNLLDIFMAFVGYSGASKESGLKCHIWSAYNVARIIFQIVHIIMLKVMKPPNSLDSFGDDITIVLISLYIVFELYIITIVESFAREIRGKLCLKQGKEVGREQLDNKVVI